MKSRTLSGANIQSLDVAVNAFLSGRDVYEVLFSNLVEVSGIFYLNIIYTAK